MAKEKRVSVALIGGETLLGRELKDSLAKLPAVREVIQLSAGAPGDLKADEQQLLPSMASANLKDAPIVVLAGSTVAKDLLKWSGKTIIDAAGVLEDSPEARLRAPLLEHAAGFEDARGSAKRKSLTGIQVIGHPAAVALALTLKGVQRISPIRRSVALIFEPASERGQAGVEELQKQTVGLLSFKKPPQEIYDAQLSFNLLPRYGDDAPLALEDVELKIERHLASLLSASAIPMPSLRLVQAPVFHGYSLSLWIEFENNPGADALASGLTSARIDVRTAEHEPPTNSGAAGQTGITVGAIAADRNYARACWLWVVADNLKLIAENTVEVAREALG